MNKVSGKPSCGWLSGFLGSHLDDSQCQRKKESENGEWMLKWKKENLFSDSFIFSKFSDREQGHEEHSLPYWKYILCLHHLRLGITFELIIIIIFFLGGGAGAMGGGIGDFLFYRLSQWSFLLARL